MKQTPQDLEAAIPDRLFWDGTVRRDRIKVAVGSDGVATLSGSLDSWSEIRAAADDATRAGAKRVINTLRLAKAPER